MKNKFYLKDRAFDPPPQNPKTPKPQNPNIYGDDKKEYRLKL